MRSSLPLDKIIEIFGYYNIEIFQNIFIPRIKCSCCFASELHESTDIAVLCGLFVNKRKLNQSCWNLFGFVTSLPTGMHTEEIQTEIIYFSLRNVAQSQSKGIQVYVQGCERAGCRTRAGSCCSGAGTSSLSQMPPEAVRLHLHGPVQFKMQITFSNK